MFKKVACAVSGGVDSAVALFLLKRRGFDVVGVHMQNWDNFEESGNCSFSNDEIDARKICNLVGVEFVTLNFVKEFWHDVFKQFLRSVESGRTPNPDVLCNKYIKFDAFFNYAQKTLNADAIATGHYAANSFGEYLDYYSDNCDAKLRRPTDKFKDQTLFLCQISQSSLRKTMFPLARMLKPEVKALAEELGFYKILQHKRESVGICMIGKRNFQSFIDEYIPPKPGQIFDIDTGELLGRHTGVHHYIIGQRLRGVSANDSYHVAIKCLESQEIFACYGHLHSSLFITSFETLEPYWLNKEYQLVPGTSFVCQFRYEHPQPLSIDCTVHCLNNGCLKVECHFPLRAMNTGQYAVFCLRDECLGSAEIDKRGLSLYEQSLRKLSNTYSNVNYFHVV